MSVSAIAPTARSPLAHAPPPGSGKARELGGGAGLGGTAVQNGQRDCASARDSTQAYVAAPAARWLAISQALRRVGHVLLAQDKGMWIVRQGSDSQGCTRRRAMRDGP